MCRGVGIEKYNDVRRFVDVRGAASARHREGRAVEAVSSATVAGAGCGPAVRVAPLDEKSARGVTVADAQRRTRDDAGDRDAAARLSIG